MQPEKEQRSSVVLLGLLVEGGLVLLAWLAGWLLGQPPLERFRWSAWDALLGAAASGPLLLLFLLCLRWPLGPLARIKQLTFEFIIPLFAPCTLFDLALISVLAGFGEEMLFRGVLQGLFTGWLGVWPGLLAASVMFGLAHLITPTYAVLATLMGAYLGFCYHASDNLLVVIAAHALYDFLVLMYLVRRAEPPSVRC